PTGSGRGAERRACHPSSRGGGESDWADRGEGGHDDAFGAERDRDDGDAANDAADDDRRRRGRARPPSSSATALSIDGGRDSASDSDSDSDDGFEDDRRRRPARRRRPPDLLASRPHLRVLPVLLLEFLSLALTRAVLPSLLLERYGSRTYVVMGGAECVRGMLAFLACPVFGRWSDRAGRRPCLLVTVAGTLAPVCSLALWGAGEDSRGAHDAASGAAWGDVPGEEEAGAILDGVDAGDASGGSWYPTFRAPHFGPSEYLSSILPSVHRIDIFVALLALSGVFSSTFTLTFAYISDVVKDRDGRVGAYGLALATFGLSFTIGPLLGGYLANVDDEGKGHGGKNWMGGHPADEGGDGHVESHANFGSIGSAVHPIGQHRVFATSLFIAVLDLFYIHFLLPESLDGKREGLGHATNPIDAGATVRYDPEEEDDDDAVPSSVKLAATSDASNVPHPAGTGVSRRASPSRWNPLDAVRCLASDPLLSTVGKVTFLYYTALHAVVSTLTLYAARQFHLGPQRLGELMSALGLATMTSEAVLVRVLVPALGEARCARIGLASFALQCAALALADRPWHLFLCAFLSMAGNLVYPSMSSLVSSRVKPEMVGRALGAVNGVKSLTEGVGPLLFGTLLTASEKHKLPGWPYFLAAVMVAAAHRSAGGLSDEEGEEYAAYEPAESWRLLDGADDEDEDDIR
ncbi:hypothetical protein ACHAWF_008711, partial [Thalassiosira exigua]